MQTDGKPEMPDSLEAAWQLHQAGDIRRAQLKYLDVLQRNPNEPNALHHMGLAAYQTNRPDDAIYFLEKALRISPAEPQWYYDLARAYRMSQLTENARQAVERAIQLNPTVAGFHSYLGNICVDLNRVEEAIACHTEALRLQSNEATALFDL
ncbi:MAG: tetratricopeptide repeat protein, partial [Gammaproteobacteria bacterium]|nr:tetratricopeptide repeat protein [Gammaproteobacteria bacterium]